MAGRSDRRDDRRARHDDRRHDRRPGVATFDDRRDRETEGVPLSEAARVCAHQLAVRHQQREMKAKLARGSSSISLPALDRFLSEHCLPNVEFLGKKEQTHTVLKKSDLAKNKVGRIVCKKASENGKKAYSRIQPWNTAVRLARMALGVKGFKAVKKGTPLYTKAKSIYGLPSSTSACSRRRPWRTGSPSPPEPQRLATAGSSSPRGPVVRLVNWGPGRATCVA
jgi:hypothetical protein